MRGLTDINLKTHQEILQENVLNYVDWSFVDAGAYFNTTNELERQDSDNYTFGTMWQLPHSDLVWESGISKGTPNYIEGIFINDSFSPINSGYYVDYLNGNVIFDTEQTGTISGTYSYKWASVNAAKDVPFFSQIRERGYYDGDFHPSDFSPYNTRQSLPTISVEVIRRTNQPYSLGGWERIAQSDVKLYILGKREGDVNRIGDILTDQSENTFYLYDGNQAQVSGAYPFSNIGKLVDANMTYEGLTKLNIDGGYRYNRCRINNTTGESTSVLSKNLYYKTVTWNTETILAGV